MLVKRSGSVPRPAEELRYAIEEFLKSAKEPALLEPGEDLLPLTGDNLSLEMRGSRLTLAAWDRTRNWTRRIVDVAGISPARLEMTVEKFARHNWLAYGVVLWVAALRSPLSQLFGNGNASLEAQGWIVAVVLGVSFLWAIAPAFWRPRAAAE